ncbi:MAG TPA: citrate/2-methylcitrate synthase, partial [Candidatus Sumerlaeota bacterium]|nr:citrate/2-methylcitrate synthase [Candidatus Sumerlaeota bacterium]
MTEKAKLIIDGKEYELPMFEGTEGERAIDITRLRAETGCVAFDPSYANVGSCRSAITFIDGEKGILRYRGIPIEQFERENPNFVEVAWLIIFGRLPKTEELADFSQRLTENAHLHEALKYHFEGFPITAPPMAILSAMINAMSCFYPELFQLEDHEKFEAAAARLISKVRTIAAYSYRSSRGMPFIAPHPKLRYCANFLHMMFSEPYGQYEVDPVVEDALNLVLLLHADHEQNCSTSTVRMVGSSRANL